ncbi:tetratricopeptide repeat protein [Myxococcota bacterium]|nr:tetratricopeptide repeat protein [Myxococcota bacterium]
MNRPSTHRWRTAGLCAAALAAAPVVGHSVHSLVESRRTDQRWERAVARARQASERGDDALALRLLEDAARGGPVSDAADAAWVEAAVRFATRVDRPLRSDEVDLLGLHATLEVASEAAATAAGVERTVALGRVLSARGRGDEALVQFGETISRAPDHARARFFIGELYAQRGQTESAVDSLTRAVELDPALPNAKALLGHTLVLLDRFGTAEPFLQSALREDPASAQVRFDYALALAGQQRWREVEASLAPLLERRPVPSGVHTLFADASVENGKVPQALTAYRAAYGEHGDRAAYQKLGRATPNSAS